MDSFTLFLLHLATTWALVGLIRTVQLVQYPSFRLVGETEFSTFHKHHSLRISWLVDPLMACELLTGLALVRPRRRASPAATRWFFWRVDDFCFGWPLRGSAGSEGW